MTQQQLKLEKLEFIIMKPSTKAHINEISKGIVCLKTKEQKVYR